MGATQVLTWSIFIRLVYMITNALRVNGEFSQYNAQLAATNGTLQQQSLHLQGIAHSQKKSIQHMQNQLQ